ncbi:hypothetical protein EDC01DRAFT_402951 [Geopyxis carbonaria]|nr:hypothetical protein EDC01DRAFT_402951 [Geopyxis carbonaria]
MDPLRINLPAASQAYTGPPAEDVHPYTGAPAGTPAGAPAEQATTFSMNELVSALPSTASSSSPTTPTAAAGPARLNTLINPCCHNPCPQCITSRASCANCTSCNICDRNPTPTEVQRGVDILRATYRELGMEIGEIREIGGILEIRDIRGMGAYREIGK